MLKVLYLTFLRIEFERILFENVLAKFIELCSYFSPVEQILFNYFYLEAFQRTAEINSEDRNFFTLLT